MCILAYICIYMQIDTKARTPKERSGPEIQVQPAYLLVDKAGTVLQKSSGLSQRSEHLQGTWTSKVPKTTGDIPIMLAFWVLCRSSRMSLIPALDHVSPA